MNAGAHSRQKMVGRLAESPFFKYMMLAAAILAIVLPMTLTRDAEPALEIRMESRIPLFSEELEQSGFSVTYNGEPIPGATKYVFTLVNSGGIPVLNDDVKVFPGVKFGEQTEVFRAHVSETSSDEMNVAATTTGPSSAGIEFSLLNPGDYVRFCVYTKGEVPASPTLIGRVAGIREIALVDETDVPVRTSKQASAWLVVLWIITGLVALVWSVSVAQVLRLWKLRWALSRNPKYLTQAVTCSDDAVEFIEHRLKFLLARERDDLLKSAKKENLSEDELQSVVIDIASSIASRPAAVSAFIFFTVLVLPGFVTFLLFLLR